MPTALKILGQSAPAITTDATLYTVPAATSAVVSSIVVSETGGNPVKVRICVSSAGLTTTAAARAIAWDVQLAANQTQVFALGATLQTGATIVVQDSTGAATFTAFGQENS